MRRTAADVAVDSTLAVLSFVPALFVMLVAWVGGCLFALAAVFPLSAQLFMTIAGGDYRADPTESAEEDH